MGDYSKLARTTAKLILKRLHLCLKILSRIESYFTDKKINFCEGIGGFGLIPAFNKNSNFVLVSVYLRSTGSSSFKASSVISSSSFVVSKLKLKRIVESSKSGSKWIATSVLLNPGLLDEQAEPEDT